MPESCEIRESIPGDVIKILVIICHHAIFMKKTWVLSYPFSALQRLGGCPGWSASSLGPHYFVGLSCRGSNRRLWLTFLNWMKHYSKQLFNLIMNNGECLCVNLWQLVMICRHARFMWNSGVNSWWCDKNTRHNLSPCHIHVKFGSQSLVIMVMW